MADSHIDTRKRWSRDTNAEKEKSAARQLILRWRFMEWFCGHTDFITHAVFWPDRILVAWCTCLGKRETKHPQISTYFYRISLFLRRTSGISLRRTRSDISFLHAVEGSCDLPAGRGRWFSPSALLTWDPTWSSGFSSGATSTRRTWTY